MNLERENVTPCASFKTIPCTGTTGAALDLAALHSVLGGLYSLTYCTGSASVVVNQTDLYDTRSCTLSLN
jgi:hypothetical protein